jgi:hypothetical protein
MEVLSGIHVVASGGVPGRLGAFARLGKPAAAAYLAIVSDVGFHLLRALENLSGSAQQSSEDSTESFEPCAGRRSFTEADAGGGGASQCAKVGGASRSEGRARRERTKSRVDPCHACRSAFGDLANPTSSRRIGRRGCTTSQCRRTRRPFERASAECCGCAARRCRGPEWWSIPQGSGRSRGGPAPDRAGIGSRTRDSGRRKFARGGPAAAVGRPGSAFRTRNGIDNAGGKRKGRAASAFG